MFFHIWESAILKCWRACDPNVLILKFRLLKFGNSNLDSFLGDTKRLKFGTGNSEILKFRKMHWTWLKNPVKPLEHIGCEFHIYQKTWNWHFVIWGLIWFLFMLFNYGQNNHPGPTPVLSRGAIGKRSSIWEVSRESRRVAQGGPKTGSNRARKYRKQMDVLFLSGFLI